MLGVVFYYSYYECHFSECSYAESRHAKCHYAVYHYAECRNAEFTFAECNYAEESISECHVLCVILLNAVLPSAVMQIAVMLNE